MNRPVFPEAVVPGRRYSFLADLQLNAWALVAVATAILSRVALQQGADWAALVRAGVALAPLVPTLLYVRSLARWIRGLDELQRRLQLEAGLFATTATLFVMLALDLLRLAGEFPAAWLLRGIGWEGVFALVIAFVILGNLIVNRRYR